MIPRKSIAALGHEDPALDGDGGFAPRPPTAAFGSETRAIL